MVRPDRIGDVLLSLPVATLLKETYPQARLTFMVQPVVSPLLEGHPSMDQVLVCDPKTLKSGRGILQLAREVREKKFDLAVVLQTSFPIALVLALARVPLRIAPRSKIHSYLFYHRTLRQRRSEVKQHEAQYNLDLLRLIGISSKRELKSEIQISSDSIGQAGQWLKTQGWQKNQQPLIAIHPGMRGSALNWPERNYVEFITGLLEKGASVLLTFGPEERSLYDRFQERFAQKKQVFFFQGGGAETTSTSFLAALYSHAQAVVAPSTGPLHIGAALGKPVLSFYSPVRVQSVQRWGPLSNQAQVLVPDVPCPETFHCAGSRCRYYDCMEKISVSEALAKVFELCNFNTQAEVMTAPSGSSTQHPGRLNLENNRS